MLSSIFVTVRRFLEMARLLVPTGRLLLADAGVITGPISNEEVKRRSVNGYMQFVPPGVNEELLEAAGFRLIDQEDRTSSVVFNASGRLRACSPTELKSMPWTERKHSHGNNGTSKPLLHSRNEEPCLELCISLNR
jgi:hypothetical protein